MIVLIDNKLDLILVPTIGISQDGVRLGYGQGFFDKFLSQNNIETVSLVFEKQVIKKIPRSDHDILMNWILTEDRFSNVLEIR